MCSAVRSSSCGGQVLSRQPLGQRPSLYVVCHVTWSAMLRGLSCYVVCDVAWSVMSRGLSCCVVCDVAWSVMSRGLSCCVVCDVAWSVMPGQARMVFTRSEEHTSELQSLRHLVCRLLLEKKQNKK